MFIVRNLSYWLRVGWAELVKPNVKGDHGDDCDSGQESDITIVGLRFAQPNLRAL